MTDATHTNRMRAEHVAGFNPPGYTGLSYCGACDWRWPCDVALLIQEHDEEVRKLMPTNTLPTPRCENIDENAGLLVSCRSAQPEAPSHWCWTCIAGLIAELREEVARLRIMSRPGTASTGSEP